MASNSIPGMQGNGVSQPASGSVGLLGAPAVVRPSSTGQVGGFVAGLGAAVLVDSTSTGGIGSTGYTLGDVVRHMKTLGAIAP